jgi:hypothetical protein
VSDNGISAASTAVTYIYEDTVYLILSVFILYESGLLFIVTKDKKTAALKDNDRHVVALRLAASTSA